jgi:flagellar biosynthesis protein FlhF
MSTHVFEAADMRDALEQVRRALGPDALILSQKAASGRVIVEVETEDEPDSNVLHLTTIVSQSAAEPEGAVVASDEPLDFAAHFQAGLRRRVRQTPPAAGDAAPRFARDELESLFRFHRLPDALALSLAEGAACSGLSDMTLALSRALDLQMTSRPLAFDVPQMLVLLGPPGSGKTAVAAKLAAAARRHDQTVTLVTADPDAAGAVARLRAFADHLGAGFASVSGCDELSEFAGRDGWVIVDTAGCDPRDPQSSETIATALADGRTGIAILSATTDAADNGEMAAAFEAHGASAIMVTGVDRTARLGGLVAAATQGIPLAHATRSPFLADGLETLTPLSLARLLLRIGTT